MPLKLAWEKQDFGKVLIINHFQEKKSLPTSGLYQV